MSVPSVAKPTPSANYISLANSRDPFQLLADALLSASPCVTQLASEGH
jgi:hypothetical protein